MMGLIEEAPVEFQSTDGVSNAGVLLGLALLEETHLLEETRAVYGQLKNGWYGLRSLLWTLVMMALLRIKRPEQLKHHDPASLGCVLGLPRAVEVKTLRRKLSDIADRGQAAELHRRLAQRRAAEQPSALVTLYVDGHLRAYHGKHRIGQTHVIRLKRVMCAETDYWVHQAHGHPLLVVHEAVDSSFREVLRDGVLPEIRKLVGDRRVRIVFDREGWSGENWFKYMRTEYALDVLVDYSVELDDATRLVVNPRWRELDRQVASSRSRLEHAEAKYARLVLKVEEKASEENPLEKNAKGKSRQPQPRQVVRRRVANVSAAVVARRRVRSRNDPPSTNVLGRNAVRRRGRFR